MNAKVKHGNANMAHGVFLLTLSSVAMAMLLSQERVLPRLVQGGYDFCCPVDDAFIRLTAATVTYKKFGAMASTLHEHALQFYRAEHTDPEESARKSARHA